MSKKAFSFRFDGKLFTGTADICKETGLLNLATIKWSDEIEKMLCAKYDENKESYYEYMDELCVVIDNTKMFNEEADGLIY